MAVALLSFRPQSVPRAQPARQLRGCAGAAHGHAARACAAAPGTPQDLPRLPDPPAPPPPAVGVLHHRGRPRGRERAGAPHVQELQEAVQVTYIFKLMNSSGITESGESEKVLLLMESGARLHTTQYVRDKSSTPSGFTLKLRKHVRSKRLEDVRMLGYDRMILFQFGLGSNAHFIILEFYAQGNIILTDSEYTVMTLLRSHRSLSNSCGT